MEDLQALVAKACRTLGKLAFTEVMTGHISARIPGTDTLLIRANGGGRSGMRFTEADDVITVDLGGKKLSGRAGLEPPREVFIHTWMYRTRPELNAVLHAHSPLLVLFTICGKPLLPIYGGYDPPSAKMALDGIPTYPSSLPVADDRRGEEFAGTLKGRACLMRGHGITTCGNGVADATLTAIKLTELAEMNCRAQLLGDLRTIPDDDVPHFKALKGASQHDAPLWRYYCSLAGESE